MIDKFGRIKNISLLLFDLEGVLITDGDNAVEEKIKQCALLFAGFCETIKQYGLKAGIVTAGEDKNLLKDFEAIPGCVVLSSTIDKVSLVDELIEKLNIDYENIFYIGDDLLDIPLLAKVGFSAAPAHSRREVKRVVDYISPANNGKSLLEDITDLFIKNDLEK